MAGRPMKAIGDDVPPATAAFAQHLRHILNGIPMQDIAWHCKKSRSTISRILSGHTVPEENDVEIMARVCGASVAPIKELWQAAVDESDRIRSPHLMCRVADLERIVTDLTERIERLER